MLNCYEKVEIRIDDIIKVNGHLMRVLSVTDKNDNINLTLKRTSLDIFSKEILKEEMEIDRDWSESIIYWFFKVKNKINPLDPNKMNKKRDKGVIDKLIKIDKVSKKDILFVLNFLLINKTKVNEFKWNISNLEWLRKKDENDNINFHKIKLEVEREEERVMNKSTDFKENNRLKILERNKKPDLSLEALGGFSNI